MDPQITPIPQIQIQKTSEFVGARCRAPVRSSERKAIKPYSQL